MNNPLQKIKQGILENNMDVVAEGYEQMTGESLAVAKDTVESFHPEEKPAPLSELEDFTMPKKEGAIKTGRSQGEAINTTQRTNSFVDDGTEHKDLENSTPAVKLTERARTPFRKIDQVCQRCSKKVSVHPAHKREYYICDDCIRKS